MSERSVSYPRTAMVAVATIPFIAPFLFLASTALRTRADYIRDPVGVPGDLTLSHIRFAWDTANLGHAALNSLITVVVSASVLTLTSIAAAYWFLRHSSRLSRGLLVLMVSLWVIPFVIYLLPLFVMLSDAGLTDNLFVLGVVYAATNLPFGVFFMYTYLLHGFPKEVRDAAQVDGASRVREFLFVVLPLSRPALGTLAALGVVWTWGDLLLALVLLQSDGNYTLTVAASALVTRTDAGVQEGAAAALIAISPVLIVFLVAQRAIARGFTAGIGK